MTEGNNGNNTKIKDDMKLKIYETFRNRIEKAEENFWKYMIFYLGLMAGVNGIIWKLLGDNQPWTYILLSIVNIVLSTIGIVITIDYGKWFFRNMMLIANIEKRILGAEVVEYIPYSYTELENFNKIFDTVSSVFVSLFATIFIFSICIFIYGVYKVHDLSLISKCIELSQVYLNIEIYNL